MARRSPNQRQLPFAVIPLIRFTSNVKMMGPFANSVAMKALAWSLFVVITAANLWLFVEAFEGG